MQYSVTRWTNVHYHKDKTKNIMWVCVLRDICLKACWRLVSPRQDALPNGAGDVSDAKLERLERDAKDLTKRLEVVAAQVTIS